MGGKLKRVVIHGLRAPNEFIVSKAKCAVDNQIEEMQFKMMEDWLKRRQESLTAWKPSLYEEVLVFEMETELCCCRGCIFGEVESTGDDGCYLVYLYDHFVFRKVSRKFIRSLKDQFKELAHRSFILRIPGIVPAELVGASMCGMAVNKPCREQYLEGDKWAPSAFDVANKWVKDLLEQEREVKCSVIKKLTAVITVGDLCLVESQSIVIQSYTEYLCNQKVAIFNQQQYNQDLNIGQDIKDCLPSTAEENSLLPKVLDVSTKSIANVMNHASNGAVDETDWRNIFGDDDEDDIPDARLNLESTMFGMAVAGKFFAIHNKSRKTDHTLTCETDHRVTNDSVAPQERNKKSPSPNPSVKESPKKNKNLFKRVYDPDNCFANAYNAVKPDKISTPESGRPVSNTFAFNEARIYDQVFRPNTSSNTKPVCSDKLVTNIVDSVESTKSKTNRKILSKTFQPSETKSAGAKGFSKPVIVEPKTSAHKEFLKKAQTALPTCENQKQQNCNRFGRAVPDTPNPFFINPNSGLPIMPEAKVAQNKCRNFKSGCEQISSPMDIQGLSNVSTDAVNTTKNTSAKRDRFGSIVSSLPEIFQCPSQGELSSAVSRVSNCDRVPANAGTSIDESQNPSEDVPDGCATKIAISEPKPFICTLPSWTEVKTKKSGDVTSSVSRRSESTRGRLKNSSFRQIRRDQFIVNDANGSLDFSKESHGKREECDVSKSSVAELTKNESESISASAGSFRQSPFSTNAVVDRLGIRNSTYPVALGSEFIKQSEDNSHLSAAEKQLSGSDGSPSAVPEGLSEESTIVQIQKFTDTTGPSTVSCSSDADNLRRMIAGRSFVYGKTPAQPYSSINEFPYLNVVKSGLYNNLLKKFNNLQSNVIPNILRGRNVFIIDNKRKGKSLAYMIPIVAKIMQEGKNMCKNAKTGPFAVFLTACVTKGTMLQTNMNSLLDSANVKEVVGYFVIRNDQSTKQDLIKMPCDIMITTPECLLEMIKDCDFSFERLMYLVVDDGDICVNENYKLGELEKLLQKVVHGLKSMVSRECPFQVVFVGNTWSPEMQSALKIVSDPVVVLGPLQATVFAGMKTLVEYVQNEKDKLNKFVEFFGSILRNSEVTNRIIIVCQSNDTVHLVKEEIQNKFKWTINEFTHSPEIDQTSNPGRIDGLRQRWLDPENKSLEVIACTDAVITELGITNTLQLIHFDLAATPALFSRRFCTMWTWFRSEDDRKTMLETKALSSRLFLTSEERNLLEVVTRLKELDCIIPPDLEEDYQKLKGPAENNKRLCCGFLRVGFCDKSDDTKCLSRHFLLPKDVANVSMIPMTGQVEVRIAETFSVSCYLAQLVRHYEFEDGRMKLIYDFDKEFRRRSQFLKNYYADENNKTQITSFELDQYVATWDPSTDTYLRAQIDSILNNNLPKVVRLFCLDGGHHISKSMENPQLYELPEGYGSSMPSFAVELVLANLKPPLGERDYMPSHKSKAARLINHENTLVGRICLAFGQRIWVDQFVEMDKNGRGSLYTKRSMRKEFVNLKYADYNPKHMEILYDSCENAGLSCAKYENLRTPDIGIEFERNFYCREDPIQWAHLSLYKEGDIESLAILWTSFVKNVDTIFCNQEKFADQLTELNKCMKEEIERLKNTNKIPELKLLRKYFEEGMAVVVEDPDSPLGPNDKPWVRGLITRVQNIGDNETVLYDAFLVDVGEEICNLELSQILPIPKIFVNKLPFQAIALKLDHVLPTGSSKEWTREAMEYVYKSVFPPPDEYSAKISVAATSKLETFGYPYCRYYTSFILLDELELGEKLVLGNVAIYADSGEERVKSLKSKLLQSLNTAVDTVLEGKETYDSGSDSDEPEEHQRNENIEPFEDDSDRWDFYWPNPDSLKPILGEELAVKLGASRTTNQLPAIMSSPNSESKSEELDSKYREECNVKTCISATSVTPESELRLTTCIIPAGLKAPKITWSQNSNEINLRIDIADVKTYELEVKTDKKTLTFVTVQPPDYGFEIKLYKKVESSRIDVTLLGACVKVKLFKRFSGDLFQTWPRLTKDDKKIKWILKDMDCISLDDDSESNGEEDDESSRTKGRQKRIYTQVNYDSDDTSSGAEGNSKLEEMLL